MKYTKIFAIVNIATSTSGACHPQCSYISVDGDQCLLFRMNLSRQDVMTYRCVECKRNEKILEDLM